MSRRFKLVLAYDGTNYAGWQSQPNGNGVQDHIERAISSVTREQARVPGSGRTDAGVHALGQVAHVDLATTRFTPATLLKACNAVLPPSIRIMRCGAVGKKFHARFSASSKTYRYRIWTAPVLPPLEHGRAWHVHGGLDLARLKKAARMFEGTHDFAAFAANRGHAETSTIRTVSSIRIGKAGSLLTIELQASGFLYKMARMIVGALIEVASGKTPVAELSARLNQPAGRKRGTVAPAHGLFLVRVRY